MFRKLFIIILFLSICLIYRCVFSQHIQDEYRIRIAESINIFDKLGDKVWKGWDKAPFAILFVDNDYEYLINYPSPPADFKDIGYDSLLKSEIYYRPRKFDINFFASFDALGNIPTIVVGTPGNTGYSGAHWTITLLHEHFHQLQYSQEDYVTSVKELNLAKGDSTGMWMLNYPFPYDSLPVQNKFLELCEKLSIALEHVDLDDRDKYIRDYVKTKSELKDMLNADDYNYFSFQLWQEGIARYTEYSIAKLASNEFEPSKEYKSLKDYISFSSVADTIFNNIKKGLKELTLSGYKRVAFYYVGSAEGMLLDRVNPEWRDLYFKDKFFLEKYYK